MKKAAFHNLGCKVNAYETEAMQQLLEEAGYEIVPFKEAADVYVINTCSVTNIADKKSRQMLHKAKKRNPEAVVVAVGCYVQAAGEELRKDAAIDLLIGNHKKADLVQILNSYFVEKEKNNYRMDIASVHEYEKLSISKIADHTRAFIKIQDGCNQFCSYCIIPYTRGRVRSRKPSEIIEEVKSLIQRGYGEIVLTGIHLSSYGIDFSEKEQENLLGLILRLNQLEGLLRIRLGSLEPRIVTKEFAETLAGMDKICPHFHLSLQSGCDRTLKRMNRHYTTEDYWDRCKILRKAFANPAITTDVIVGFPGETVAEFEATKDFLEKVHFYEMHIFKYSRRAGTGADQMKDQVAEEVKSLRSDQLLALNAQMSKSYRESFQGMQTDVLLEETVEFNGKKYMMGHTKEYMKAAIPCEFGERGNIVRGRLGKFLDDEIMYLEQKI